MVTLGGDTMGTSWSVRFAEPTDCDIDGVERAILRRLDAIIAEMSHWRPDSLISAYNGAPQGTAFTLPEDFRAVVETALDIARRSDGAFDPTIGRLVGLAGYGPDPSTRSNADTLIADARRSAGWRRLPYAGGQLVQPGGLSLDFSGIAKGYAVDVVADLLASLDIAHALVEIGGELVGRGVRPDGEPWWVDLEDPPGVTLPPLRIALHGLAVATSGDYRRGAHTLHPESGLSTDNGIRSVSVIHRTAMEADAWATALTVLGADRGMEIAAREGLAARIVTTRETLSPILVEMLE